MAWNLHSLEDLEMMYDRLQDRNIPIDHVSDHSISLGIYFRDPDGNGIEVYDELPRSEWHREDHMFSGEGRMKGRFPDPWASWRRPTGWPLGNGLGWCEEIVRGLPNSGGPVS